MKLGIIGLPLSGKTTIFNALTRGNQPTTTSGGRIEVHTAVVDVPDPRLDQLSDMFKPSKTIYAKVTYADITGLDGSVGKSGISGTLLNSLSQMDGLLHVVRCFENDNVPHPSGRIDPLRDISMMENELLLNDLIMVERKLERLQDEHRKGGTDRALNERQTALFERMHAFLSEEKPLRQMEFSQDEARLLAGYALLSRKPLMTVFNLHEGQISPAANLDHPTTGLPGKLEMEIAQLPQEDANLFMEEYGITESALHRMIRLSYDLLKVHSFFTIGDDEVRAWTIQRGSTAVEAAAEVHTDLARGFIRAEVIQFDEMIALGGMAEAKARGKLRLEGKEYPVKDGDIIQIRSSL